MKLILIRHLPTEYNKSNVLQGSLDIPIADIDEQARKQIHSNKIILDQIKFDQIYCSNLIRTQETSRAYGYNDFDIEPKLDELNFGIYEGKPKSRMLNDNRELWMNDPGRMELGEPVKSLFARVDSFLDENRKSQNVLVFTHGAVGRYIISRLVYNDGSLMNKMHFPNNVMVSLKQ